MFKRLSLALSVMLCLRCLSAAGLAPVKTEAGLVQGAVQDDLIVYRGIPFAAPPVGALRWQPPQPVEAWTGVRSATQFAPDPYQGNGSGNVSEDCLYLNIWRKALAGDDRLPVLVWIYGGGFAGGGTSGAGVSGEHLARKGVMLVSFNYRVGSLGFLAHPELSGESPHRVSGNYGILDQIAALQWIQKNIAAFGGDPDRVTIFGESAGGISVSMLCASPLAKGLFHGAISQSGGSFGPHRVTTYPGENMRLMADAERAGEEYARKAGVSSISELRALPPQKLPPSWGSGASWPIIDGWVIVDDQHKLYEEGKYNDVPILVGYNSDEGLSFWPEKTSVELIGNVQRRYGPYADRLLAVYPPGNSTVPKSGRDLTRDAAFGWHTWTWARLQSRTGKASVYFYYFDQHPVRKPDAPDADHGMPHGADVGYVFQTLDRNDPKLRPADFAISETVSTYWTNFAKRGNPNGTALPLWPEFSEKKQAGMHFRDDAKAGDIPSRDGLEVLDSYFAWRRTAEGAAWAK